MRPVILAFCFGAGAAVLPVSGAHTEVHGKHGGIVRHVDGLQIEVVARPEGALFYLEARGKPVPTQGMGGKVVVANGMEKSEAELTPVGENKLLARGIRLQAGSQGLASLRTAPKKAITLQFIMK